MSTVINIDNKTAEEYRQKIAEMGDGRTATHLFHLIKSRYKILYIQSPEEVRVIQCLRLMSLAEGFDLFQWDCSRGLLDAITKQPVKSASTEVHQHPNAVLTHILDHAKQDNKLFSQNKKPTSEGHIYMLLDFYGFMRESNPQAARKLKEFAYLASATCIVFIAPLLEIPATLQKEITVIDFPFPSRSEIREALMSIRQEIPPNYPKAHRYISDHEEELIDAATGLTITEAENAFALTLIKNRTFHIPTIIEEKKQIIRKSGILEFCTPRYTFENVGGLDRLKKWFRSRRLAFSQDAHDFGLPSPRGVLLCGVPGTGKSLCCDALANYWQMPLLRLDMGAIFGSLVGESERKVREVIKTVESIVPSILWVDEVEKGIAGGASARSSDGGTTQRVFATLLTWLQEKTAAVFVVCTANNVFGIPPEFMRAGRFDEVFFIDLPNDTQRFDVIQRLLVKHKRPPEMFELEPIVSASKNFSPAEIEKAICNGLFVAYADGKRQLRTLDIVAELNKVQPLYNSRREEIDQMRSWAIGEDGLGGKALLANSTDDEPNGDGEGQGRNLSFTEFEL